MLKISIEYCRVWNYTPQTVSLFNELMQDKAIEAQIEILEIIPSSGGRFEVIVNSELVYSKLTTGRHANPGEIHKLIKDKLS